jgi:4-amino-4-deoxy-L-arabinose transferase-like glycosyltransferase
MATKIDYRRWGSIAVAALLALVGVFRVLSSYEHTAQAFDEPYHVGAAIELLDKGTYTLDTLHPPLQRIAIGVPLYLAGERYPNLSLAKDSSEPLAAAEGNAVLNDGGHYARNLALARLGVLAFLLLGCLVVFLWARREYGDFAGAAAVGLFTTLPIVLAFSSIAYTDIVAAAMQVGACWAFATWLEKGNRRSTVGMGFALGLALLAKTTTYIYLPACALSMVLLKWGVARSRTTPQSKTYGHAAKQVAAAGVIALAVLWAGYGFSVGRVRESMQISAESMPSFQHFPAPLARIGRALVSSDAEVPAPALIRGLADAWVMEKSRPAGYLFGHLKPGGWWYFFLVGVGVKSPIPFLILVLAGLFSFHRLAREGRWTAMAPAACALAILLVTMPVKINYGVRHVLVVFPLLAIVAGHGCAYLWDLKPGNGRSGDARGLWRGCRRVWRRAALVALLLWQCVSTVRASGDYIAYFNEFAGSDPSTILVAGCDLDCGQDLFALSHELQVRHVSHASLALWTSADMSKMSLPEFDIPQPFEPVTGWFAISLRALRAGDLFHTTYPPDAFVWLRPYQPVARVGKTILLYYIPDEPVENKSK